MKLIQKRQQIVMSLLSNPTTGSCIHTVFQQEQFVVEMLNGSGFIHAFRVMDRAPPAAAKGKGPGNADGAQSIQPVRILDAFPLDGFRYAPVRGKRNGREPLKTQILSKYE